MNRPLSHFALSLFLCGSLVPLPGQEPAESPAASETPHSRVVKYAERDVVPVNAKIRYTTLIILPEDERILDFTCGDKDYWIVDGNENFAFVKPAKAGAATNVNLVTAAGNVYSFVLTEVSESGGEPDLKVFVEPTDASMLRPQPESRASCRPRRSRTTASRSSWPRPKPARRRSRRSSSSTSRSRVPLELPVRSSVRLQVPARPEAVLRGCDLPRWPIHVHQGSPEETPALYELKDGKPNLVNFDFQDGIFVVPKVLETGYLAIGKEKLRFVLEGLTGPRNRSAGIVSNRRYSSGGGYASESGRPTSGCTFPSCGGKRQALPLGCARPMPS